ncbi:Protein zer-1 [Mactra antiquata]
MEEPQERKDCPESLQDLCICYCMNNLDVLTASMERFFAENEDVSASFSFLFGNRMLDYYSSSIIPTPENQIYVNQLLQNSQLCSQLSLKRRNMYTIENLEELSNNKLRSLDVYCSEYADARERETVGLIVEKNIGNLTSVRIAQDWEDGLTTGLLNVLAGIDYDTDSSQINLMKVSQGDMEGAADLMAKGFDAVSDEKVKKWDDSLEDEAGSGDMPSNTKYQPFKVEAMEYDVESASGSSEQHLSVAPNLKFLSYEQVSTPFAPNFEPASSFGWFYLLFSRIFEINHNIHSFSLMSIISHPIGWFLSMPHLSTLQNLQSLTLSFEHIPMFAAVSNELEIPYVENFFENLPALKSLRHLSITYFLSDPDDNLDEDWTLFTPDQVTLFLEAVKKMPQIKSLDVSGTNLHQIIRHEGHVACRDHCMPGFVGRQFEFIGLFNTEACSHKFIPALKVSGNSSIEQLLVALWSLHINGWLISNVLRQIAEWLTDNHPSQQVTESLIEGYLNYLRRIGDLDIKEDGSTIKNVYFYFLKGLYLLLKKPDGQRAFTTIQRRLLIEKLMVVCHNMSTADIPRGDNNQRQRNMMKIFILKVFHNLPKDSIFQYPYRFETYIRVLVELFLSPAVNHVQMLCLVVLHNACRYSQECKEIAGGKMELVETLLMYLVNEIQGQWRIGSEIVQKVWSILWTLTDDVESNCVLFVKHAGIDVSKVYINLHQEDKALIRKISGAMSNVAEHKHLKEDLLTEELVKLFRDLLHVTGDNGETDVSSHAAAYLIMLAADGPESWTIDEPSSDVVLQEIDHVITHNWNIQQSRGVRFRTLKPILKQIQNVNTPVAQLWGAWLVCNLVIVNPMMYCKMVIKENGLDIINKALEADNLRSDTSEILNTTLNICRADQP